MTDKLPPNLLALFAPRPPLRWVPPSDKPPEQRKTATITGLADYLPAVAEYEREYEYHPTESWLDARERKKREKKEAAERLLAEGPKHFNPNEDPNIRGDAFKTLIVARLDYKADEQDLEREFGRFGPIERIRIIRDTHADEKGNKKRKPHRGYAFIVFDREKDMRAALDGCDGIRIKDRRIKVDVERGRTVKGWRPRRLGGGLGGRGYTKAMPNRPMGPGGFGGPGGFRGGGFGGGFRGRDRGFRGGPGGGFGDRGGGFRGGSFGDRSGGGGFGDRGGNRNFGGPNGFAPSNAPNGPGGGRDDRRGPSGPGGYGRDGGGRSYDDRSGGYRDRNPRQSGSNMEPIRPRGENGGYHGGEGGSRGGRDYDRPREHEESRKRGYEGGYEDPRKLRRY
ncbi:U1 small nuclear ribonucleoprotein of 70kDa MW N terminal-domain-containing protein [Echria macrotheca]|uniref:U1 small nuclear ribonucleoprotein of 70kDa MW N terminal-domain-containing protein n=1 Tax=Echria macrotheca TaxID=438768 RepID=A0AAJ0B4S1_9PEZI|nr:U1 small nuclear ribonucleoprotein of 70kDa MW N terminal-domain-containing protein [Echria macrotheca]